MSKTIEHNLEQITKYQIAVIISAGKNNERKRETTFILLTNLEQSVKMKLQTHSKQQEAELEQLTQKQELLHHLKIENGFAMWKSDTIPEYRISNDCSSIKQNY